MRRNDRGKYDLETKLRTWTEHDEEQAEMAKNNPELAAQRAAKQKRFHEMRKKWGGCPDGCSHGLDKSSVIDQNDKDVIEKAMNGYEAKSKNKKAKFSVRVDPPDMTSSEDEHGVSDAEAPTTSAIIRGRDGGGSKSGFNSDYEAEDETDSDREKLE